MLAPASSTDRLHIHKVWTLPRGTEIDDGLAARTFHTEDEVKAALTALTGSASTWS